MAAKRITKRETGQQCSRSVGKCSTDGLIKQAAFQIIPSREFYSSTRELGVVLQHATRSVN